MIPKVIHYCWFGRSPKSKLIKKCIESWREKCPEYEIIEWNENNFDINCNKYTRTAYENKKWAFLSDYVRLWVIYNYGGIYLDVDVELLKSLDDILKFDIFFATEEEQYIATGLGFGANRKNSIVKSLMDDYNNEDYLSINGEFDPIPCPIKNTKVFLQLFPNITSFKNDIETENMRIYSTEYFCPYDKYSHKLNLTENSYAIHWYNASWLNKKTKFKIGIKRFLKQLIGNQQYEIIKKMIIK